AGRDRQRERPDRAGVDQLVAEILAIAKDVPNREVAKAERGVVGDARTLAIGLAAVDPVVERTEPVGLLLGEIALHLRVELAESWSESAEGEVLAQQVKPARKFIRLEILVNRRALDR